jgi:hypothetical protein
VGEGGRSQQTTATLAGEGTNDAGLASASDAASPAIVEADAGGGPRDAAVDALGDGGPSARDAIAAPDLAAPPLVAIPSRLSEAGLYEADLETLVRGVRPYRPRYELWSDGADKRRWIWLPEDASIDTSDMDYWSYPSGTRLYKEFSVDGVRVETRLLERREDGTWWMMSYHWRDDQSDADAVPDGVVDASGTEHDIPDNAGCRYCHLGMPDKVLGFSAIQLSHESEPEDLDEWTLSRLEAAGKLSTPAPATSLFPDDDLGRDALGYLHANCGHCHHPRSGVSSRIALSLWLRADALVSVVETVSFASTVGREVILPLDGSGGYPLLIAPGAPFASALLARMASRGASYSMPPLATERVDAQAAELIERWIESLAAGAPEP